MKKHLLFAFQLITVGLFAQFAPNNLAVSKISSPNPITNAGFGFQTNIVEFTTAGVATGTNINLTGSGTDFVIEDRPITHEGQLNLSANKNYLMMCGYNSPVAPTSTAAVIRASNKIIARIDGAGTIDMTTKVLPINNFNGVSIRSVASEDGLSYFVNSSSQSTFHGTRKIDHGSEEATLFNNTGNSPHRSLYYHNGRIIATTQGASNVYSINAEGVSTQMPFAPQDGYHDYAQIVVFDVDPEVSWDGTGLDLMYIADRNNGLRKFYFNGTQWTPVSASGLYNTSFLPTAGFWALTGRLEDGKPALYGIKIFPNTGAHQSSSLVKVVDNSQRTEDWNTLEGFLPTATQLATTGNTEMFKGVAFTPGSSVQILPISVKAFTGSLIKEVATLKWTTLSEINAKEFQIERSTNGVNFAYVGSVTALNRSAGASYSYNDNGLSMGNNYYRLKLVDKDAQYAYSKVIVIGKGDHDGVQVTVYPNPTTGVVNILHPRVGQKTTLLISDLSGRIILQKELGLGTSQSAVNVSSFAKGQYNIIITNENGRIVSKFIK